MLHSRLRSLPRKGPRATHKHEHAPNFSNDNNHNEEGEEDEEEEEEEESEDIFSDFLSHLLPDDAHQFHGDPGQLLRYESPLYGPLTIMVPHYPDHDTTADQTQTTVDDGRRLFAHFLWSSALVVAQGVEDADADAKGAVSNGNNNDNTNIGMWNVKGHRVLELGAGAGLPSIISALASASHVTITDHPSSPAFLGAIEYNTMRNVPASIRLNIESMPHEWGTLGDDDFSRQNRGQFTRIIAADCLWMLHQHENLVRTLLWFLSEGGKREGAPTTTTSPDDSGSTSGYHDQEGKEDGEEEGRVWIVAGFHTGRAIVAHFFETAVAMGLEIESIYERDILSM
ncbi:hypothetical protein UA08_04230 [Talaromyces atroroseus]|uniref:Nicotinamide N-methyltransferase n=1 Tax=Talaromyces atroroseus TaxID=1441469 RepID=A0A1Q5Q9M5_TALAT|nr:hypothetical protein UA08_04230 [Talaromyces atroroseus]OKL60660.1 hypothetical protein UA08_04230 [Talaromyces atroroseus]